MHYDHKQYGRAFFRTNLALGLISKDAGNQRNYWPFKHGYALYDFDLKPSLLDGDQTEITIELTFSRVLPDPMQGLIYAELDLVLEISKPDKR